MIDLVIGIVFGISIGGFLCYRLVEIEMGWQKLSREEIYEISGTCNVNELRASKFCMASNFSYLVLMAVARDDLLERSFFALMMPVAGVRRIVAERYEAVRCYLPFLGR